MKYGIGIGILAVLFSMFYFFNYYEEVAIHSYESDLFCESFNVLKKTSSISRDHKKLLGKFYARGLCIPQNIRLAEEIYTDVYNNDLSEIGKQLFYNGLEIVDFSHRKKVKADENKIRNLFQASKRLGFNLSKTEIDELNKYELMKLYN